MVKPDESKPGSKKEQVEEMFDNISSKYDFLNHFLSLGIDKLWRKRIVRILRENNCQQILDIATGTGDLAIAISKIANTHITGVDISNKMLAVGREKILNLGLEKRIELVNGDSENLQYKDNSFDAVCVAFGVRNFEDLEKGLNEMHRVLKPGGKCVILEFALPTKFPVKQFYHFYFNYVCPFLGRKIAKDDRAYKYLARSVNNFPYNEAFIKIFDSCGFKRSHYISLSFGIASIYVGEK
ncbi:MAG: bifunctional demethylmenaquinone methyltransferase/2-methoxy-6-polyprenyl-1,4-benzoquinol methylase UbiE [Bacteroidia bacterium]|nr:bifunctional demethylmenaquinone methyltransferase/2-methoxy-6-polyprenyl-1,4-benzoquinol methylase UbiE [Bacteroidia bacterium]